MKKCSMCGKKKPDVKKRINPYNQDVNGDTTKEYLCEDCENNLMDEI